MFHCPRSFTHERVLCCLPGQSNSELGLKMQNHMGTPVPSTEGKWEENCIGLICQIRAHLLLSQRLYGPNLERT